MIKLSNRDLSKLARIKSGRPEGDPKHTQVLGEFARALGYSNAPTMMAMAKAKDADAGTPAPATPERWPGPVVMGEFRSDDYKVRVKADVRPWLATLSADDFGQLALEDFSAGYASDAAYHHLLGGENDLKDLETYLGYDPRTINDEAVGFTVEIPDQAAVEWMVRNRPELKDTLIELREEFGIEWDEAAEPESWKSTGERAKKQPSEPLVIGKFRSDDKAVNLSVDVRPWLATLNADDFRRLVSDEFEDLGNSAFHHLRDQSEELRALEDYMGPNPVARTAAGDPIGFTTNINRLTSVEWMVRNRPDLKETILDLHDEFGIDWSPDAVPESWDIPMPKSDPTP